MLNFMLTASAVLWVGSSVLWLWSSLMTSPFAKVSHPKVLSLSTDGPFIMGGVDWEKAIAYFNKQSRVNFWAAFTSGLAALAAGLAVWVSLLPL